MLERDRAEKYRSHPGKYFGQKWNFFIIGLLIIVVLLAFFWQAQQTKHEFLNRATEHSLMLAGMISFSLKNANHSQAALEKTIHSFLASTAKFTDYLDSVEPFTTEELSAFANETTLAGIKLLHYNEVNVEGPPGWAPDLSCKADSNSLLHYPERNLYVLVWPATEPGCILLGFNSTETDRLMLSIGLEQLMDDLSRLPLVEYIRLHRRVNGREVPEQTQTRIIKNGGLQIAESQIQFDSDTILIVGVDASTYAKRIQQLFEECIFFSILLSCLGGFFSWLISRNQASHLKQVRRFERELARQHEEATLGRAAATISHEIKNPLNAISMGLQRLQMEVPLPEEQSKLITSMRQAVGRTNNIIADLKQYTKPVSLQLKEVIPNQLLEDVLVLYKENCDDLGITVTRDMSFRGSFYVDEALIGQAIENMFKNAIEAQPEGGRIHIITAMKGDRFVLSMENPGFMLDAADKDTILQPYYTTKTQGTGLGLAVIRRIIESHGGTIDFSLSAPGVIVITIELPVNLTQ